MIVQAPIILPIPQPLQQDTTSLVFSFLANARYLLIQLDGLEQSECNSLLKKTTTAPTGDPPGTTRLLHTYIHMNTQTHVHILTYTFMHTFAHTTLTCSTTHVHTRIIMYTHTHTHNTYMQHNTCAHTHNYVHTHTHTHTYNRKGEYRIVQNSDGVGLWQINHSRVLARKSLVNLQ